MKGVARQNHGFVYDKQGTAFVPTAQLSYIEQRLVHAYENNNTIPLNKVYMWQNFSSFCWALFVGLCYTYDLLNEIEITLFVNNNNNNNTNK